MPLNSPKHPPYWNSTSGFDFDHITTVDISFCTSLQNFIQTGPPSAEKMTSCRFSRWRISAMLDFRGPIMSSSKSSGTTSYRSSIDTTALKCLVWENSVFVFWHMALESWQWIHQVAASCNVISGSRMTCHWIRQNIHHIGILHLVSILTISPQSTCHSAPACEFLSKLDHPRQKKMMLCRFSRWRISATMLDFRGPVMGSLKSPCTTSYRSSIDTTALKCLVSEKIAFLYFGNKRTDRQTNRRTESMH